MTVPALKNAYGYLLAASRHHHYVLRLRLGNFSDRDQFRERGQYPAVVRKRFCLGTSNTGRQGRLHAAAFKHAAVQFRRRLNVSFPGSLEFRIPKPLEILPHRFIGISIYHLGLPRS